MLDIIRGIARRTHPEPSAEAVAEVLRPVAFAGWSGRCSDNNLPIKWVDQSPPPGEFGWLASLVAAMEISGYKSPTRFCVEQCGVKRGSRNPRRWFSGHHRPPQHVLDRCSFIIGEAYRQQALAKFPRQETA